MEMDSATTISYTTTTTLALAIYHPGFLQGDA